LAWQRSFTPHTPLLLRKSIFAFSSFFSLLPLLLAGSSAAAFQTTTTSLIGFCGREESSHGTRQNGQGFFFL
jgi:hypothetical protein